MPKKKSFPKADKGNWGPYGSSNYYTLPDGTYYNPSTTKVETFRKMRKDYQINACLNVLTFTIQKMDWYLEGGTRKANSLGTEVMENIWNDLIRGMAKSFWAGYSPMVKVFTQDKKGRVVYKRIKDLSPESCRVLIGVDDQSFDGFKQFPGQAREEEIETEYAFWYPNDMEDGNLYGRSRLTAAYKSWYYSEIIHLFANRYYERFGEPVVMGRAPNEDIKDDNGSVKNAMDIMHSSIEELKSHSSITIPSDKDEEGNEFYDVKYLESQMRGVDFDTYLKRLDMEKARAIFVPDLLLGTGNVGSYNLGKEHKSTFLDGLMGTFDDMVAYIQRYLLEPIIRYNFGENATVPKFKYLPLSKSDDDLIINLVTALINGKMAKPDFDVLAERIGIPLEEAEMTTQEPTNEESRVITKRDDDESLRKDIVEKQLIRLENGIRKAVGNHSKESAYDALSNLSVGYIGKIYDRLGEDVGQEFRKKQKKAASVACNLFMSGKDEEEIIKAVKKDYLKGEKFTGKGDFVEPDNYMPRDVNEMDIVYRNLFRDEFRKSYEKNGNPYIARRKAEEAISDAISEANNDLLNNI